MQGPKPNWFEQGGDAYARYRPDYPDSLAQFLAQVAPSTELALDVGCGTGQLTRALAEQFDAVIGIDPSADQLAHAVPHERIQYRVAPAERMEGVAPGASLVTAAQAAHWFDLPRFYDEVRRVSVPGAMLALISYGVPRLDDALNNRFLAFYTDEIGPYWPPERRLVDSGYVDLPFPFPERKAPELEIRREWNAHDFLGYLSTWSATRRAHDAGKGARLAKFSTDLFALWGDPNQQRTIVWPINMRLGEVA